MVRDEEERCLTERERSGNGRLCKRLSYSLGVSIETDYKTY